MDPRPRLIQACHELRRTVYASLPWGLRLGRALFELRFGGTAEDIGKTAYGLFLLYGVTDMPETKFMPKNTREISRLPSGYGKEFGKSLEGIALKFKTVNGADPEELLATLWGKLFTTTSLKSALEGKPLSEAKRYVQRMLQFIGVDWARQKTERQERQMEDIDTVVDAPAGDWESLSDVIPAIEQKEIMRDLAQVGGGQLKGKLPLYFKLLLEGYSNEEILSQELLGEGITMSNAGLAKYREVIKEVIHKHLLDEPN